MVGEILFTIFPNISTTIRGSQFWGRFVKNGGELPTAARPNEDLERRNKAVRVRF